MKEEKFVRLQRRRAQTEARISILKRGFLGRPMRAKGFANRELALAWGVLTHNLWMFARLAPAPQAFAAFSSGKIKADMLAHLPHLRDRLQGWDNHVKAGKGLVFLHPDFADRLVTAFSIRALVVPHVARQAEPALRLMSPGDAFRAFGPSTVIWLPGAEAENYRFTAELTRRLPCSAGRGISSARN